MTSTFHQRIGWFTLVFFAAAALRLHHLDTPDLNIDEAWSFIHAYGFVNPPSDISRLQVLFVEVNNMLHLLIVSPWTELDSTNLGLRWMSFMVGLLNVALTARLAKSLKLKKSAVLLAPLLMAFAFEGIHSSQIGRPYVFATTFALLSMIFWLENNWGYNLLANVGMVLSHVTALPALITQDIFTAVKMWSKPNKVTLFMWITNRIFVYGLVGILYQLGSRNWDEEESENYVLLEPSGIQHLIENLFNILHGKFSLYQNALDWDEWLFLGGVILPFIILFLYMTYQHQFSRPLFILGCWLAGCYGMLVVVEQAFNMEIFYHYLSPMTPALVVLIALVITNFPSPIWRTIALIYIVANLFSFRDYYEYPYRQYSTFLREFRQQQPQSMLYLEQATLGWALQLNNPDDIELEMLEDERPVNFWYIVIKTFDPEIPSECSNPPVLSESEMDIYYCER